MDKVISLHFKDLTIFRIFHSLSNREISSEEFILSPLSDREISSANLLRLVILYFFDKSVFKNIKTLNPKSNDIGIFINGENFGLKKFKSISLWTWGQKNFPFFQREKRMVFPLLSKITKKEWVI